MKNLLKKLFVLTIALVGFRACAMEEEIENTVSFLNHSGETCIIFRPTFQGGSYIPVTLNPGDHVDRTDAYIYIAAPNGPHLFIFDEGKSGIYGYKANKNIPLASIKSNKVTVLFEKGGSIKLIDNQPKTYYTIIGVARNATQHEIAKAYRKMALQHHPDRAVEQGLSPEEAHKKFLELKQAYDVLSDPASRANYDEQLNKRK